MTQWHLPAANGWDFPIVVDEYCLHVNRLSPCCSLFAASPNLATSQPGNRVLSACAWRQRTRGVNPGGNDGPGGWDCFMKVSANFVHFYPLKKSFFCSVWRGPLSRWPSFEHSNIIHIDLCTEHCVPVSHLHVSHQNSTSTPFSTA